MPNDKIYYFAYGSNMLKNRLVDRCPSAKALGTAQANCHYISFGKKGKDGSGKAAIIKTTDKNDVVLGVLYEIEKSELDGLDAVEFKYNRNDDFAVIFNGKKKIAVTYYIPAEQLEIGLLPMDWYRDICVAGAKSHGLDAEYIAKFEALIVRKDPDNPAHKYLRELDV